MSFRHHDGPKTAQVNSMDLKEELFNRAVSVLRSNSSKDGIKAASTVYNQIWSRDSFITLLGANMLEDPLLLEAAKNSLLVLGKSSSTLGMIPVNYDLDRNMPRFFHSGATDASSWYIIGLANLYSVTHDKELLGKPLDYATDAYRWLRYQDTNNAVLIDSTPSSDWMDSSVKRQGKTLYNNVLFALSTKCINILCDVSGKSLDKRYRLEYEQVTEKFTALFAPSDEARKSGQWPWLHDFDKDTLTDPPKGKLLYHPQFITMNHVDMHFDSLSNLISVIAGLSSAEMSRSIMSYISSNRIAFPYPIKVMYPNYHADDPFFDKAYTERKPEHWRNNEDRYHNGGIWPFVGGFYVLALKKMGDPAFNKELENLAKANSLTKRQGDPGFNEWLHGKTAAPLGQEGQSWNAGMYIAAYMADRGKDPFRFLKE